MHSKSYPLLAAKEIGPVGNSEVLSSVFSIEGVHVYCRALNVECAVNLYLVSLIFGRS